MNKELMPLTKLSPNVDMFLTTNHDSPIKITGIAVCNIRESKGVPYRQGYLVFYEKLSILHKAEISAELYDALKLVFNSIDEVESPDFFLVD